MNQGDRDVLVEALEEVLERRARVDQVTHEKHHQYIEHLIDRDRARRQLLERVKTHVAGWAVVSAIASAVYYIGKEIVAFIVKIKGAP